MNHIWSKRLVQFSAIFGLVGAILGAHMAGAGSMSFRPVHAHVLVVGWLTLFAWGIYYKVFQIKPTALVHAQGWTAILGSIGLTVGLWLQYVQPFGNVKLLILPIYIGGGVVLLISFLLFVIITFVGEQMKEQ